MIYGALPDDVGRVDISPVEMMFWQYCPVATPTEPLTLPANLRGFAPILERVAAIDPLDGLYVYLTAKTLWVTPHCIGNRPGWHSDGFGTDDINYIWYDRAPTEFIQDAFTLPADCADAMAHMAERAIQRHVVTYPAKHLLRLDQRVIHRCPEDYAEGMRTFVKVSLSRDRYNLAGNSVNHELKERWPLLPRHAERNHPSVSAHPHVSPQEDATRDT